MTRGNLQRQLAQTSDDPTLEVSLTVNGERVERVRQRAHAAVRFPPP